MNVPCGICHSFSQRTVTVKAEVGWGLVLCQTCLDTIDGTVLPFFGRCYDTEYKTKSNILRNHTRA